MIQPQVEKLFGELEKSRSKLLEYLSLFPYDQLTKPPARDKWSVVQILHHLVIVEAGTMAYIQKKILAPDKVPNVKFSSRIRMIGLKVSLMSNMKFKAPSVLQVPDNSMTVETLSQQWEITRGKFYTLLEGLPEDLSRKGIFNHPLVGRIDANDTLRFIKWHYEHHLRQIYTILKS